MKTYNNLYGMRKVLDISHDKIVNDDYDGLFLIVGDEGKSKSNLGLHITDYWYSLRDGKCTADKISKIALDRIDFLTGLKESKRYDLLDYDEAGDISKKRAMSKWNVMLSQTYMVIRGLNMMSLLTLPDLFDLESFFTKRRAKGLFYVYARGKYCFYSKNRLRKIIELNKTRIIKKISLIPPTFTDTFPIYQGVLKEPYMQKKTDKMNLITQKLYDEMNSENKDGKLVSKEKLAFTNLCYYVNKEMGVPTRTISKAVGVYSRDTIQRRIREIENPLLADG